jgi:transposase-like protein
MGRPPSGLDDYLEWQQKLQQFKESGLTVDSFCQQEGVSKSTFHRWTNQLKEGIPESISVEAVQREEAESSEAVFMPITLKASPVEIELPNGGVVRLPLGVGQAVLVEVIRAVGALRPGRASTS